MPLGPAVLVPLGPAGDVRGVLTAGRHQGALPLSPAAVEMVTTFAAQAGIGLELAEHRRDVQRLALFEDRDRIARDLHDLVIQRLFATGMSLQGATALMRDPEAARRVEQAVDALDETIRDIRSAIFSLQSRGEAGPARRADQDPGGRGGDDRLAGLRPRAADGRADRHAGTRTTSPSRCWPRCARRWRTSAKHAQASRVDVAVEAGPDLVLARPGQRRGPARDHAPQRARPTSPTGPASSAARCAWTAAEGGGTELEWRVPLPGDSPAPRAADQPETPGRQLRAPGTLVSNLLALQRPGRHRPRPASGAPSPAWRTARTRSS